MKEIQGIQDKVLTRLIRKEKTEGGIVIPDNVQQLPQEYGIILSAGKDALAAGAEVGAIAVFHQQAGQVIVHETKELRVIKVDEIYGIIQNDEEGK